MLTYPNAKINLGLNVVEKRTDGYHNIESVFYPIPLSDELEITISNSFEFTSSGIQIDGSPQDNLVIKAYELLKKTHQLPPVKIHLKKVIPFGGGLGGGSSDAAFCLKMLNQLFNLNIPNIKLKVFAKQLGADCPFFIDNTPSLIEGIGDIIQPISVNLSNLFIVLVKPNIGIPTPLAYKGVKPQKPVIPITKTIISPIENWRHQLKNDFELSVFKQYSEIKTIKEKLYKTGALYASMSGSGSTVYGLFTEKPNTQVEFNDYFYYSSKL